MLIVGTELVLVEVELVGGLLGCPSCRGVLGPWGHARERVLRCRGGDRLLRPRRARCRGCAGTHVLLPQLALARRQDEVSVIGAAIEANVAGEGFRRIAARVGAYPETVRGWVRRFAELSMAIGFSPSTAIGSPHRRPSFLPTGAMSSPHDQVGVSDHRRGAEPGGRVGCAWHGR
jgi:hypothetical protein